MGRIIGIDLGTTNSLVCVWEDGRAKLIPNAFGEYLTPSVVSFGQKGEVFVGKTAKERLVTDPDNTFEFFKRYMGKDKTYGKYNSEELSSLVLRSLKADAESYLGEPVDEAVISVPAYFDDKARKATKNAGALAGLKVDRIINEPSAAALGYLKGIGRDDSAEGEEHLMLIFDFGGGTLDVSLVETFDNVVEIVSVSGDNALGGMDFDKAIADHFIKEAGLDNDKISPAVYNIILKASENAKKELTVNSAAQIEVRTDELFKTVGITNKTLIEISAPILKRIYKPVQDMLRNSKYSVNDITDVVMVGGSSKMPIIKHYLEHILSVNNICVESPDHMIAIGMGVYAGIVERDDEVKDVILTDVCPFSLGVGTYNRLNPGKSLSSFIISRNSALPVSHTQVYYPVADKQKNIKLEIFQGEEYLAEQNKAMGTIDIKLPPEATVNTPILVTFSYDINGILVVDVSVPQFKINMNKVIVNEEVDHSEEFIKQKVHDLNKLKMIDRDNEEDVRILEWGSRLFAQNSGQAQAQIGSKMAWFQEAMYRATDMYNKIRLRSYMKRYLLFVEASMLKTEVLNFKDNSWQEDEDKLVDEIFGDWED
jgi:molecular chaperone HscC